MTDPADKHQFVGFSHCLACAKEAYDTDIGVLRSKLFTATVENDRLGTELTMLETERDALLARLLAADHALDCVACEDSRFASRELDALRKELQDAHATYEPEIKQLNAAIVILERELYLERIRVRQYQWRAENDA